MGHKRNSEAKSTVEPDSRQVEVVPSNSDAYVKALLEAAVDGIVGIDEHGNIQTMNAAAERLFGYTKVELLGKNVKMLMPAPFQDEHDTYLANYLRTGQKKIIGIGREVVGLRKDGTTFPMDLSVAESRIGERSYFIGIIRDITEHKRTNDEIRAMTQQLWQTAKLASVGELAASIAHELNNPLATVSLRIESVLAKTPADDPRRRPLEIVQQEATRMGELVANLLQFSRRSDAQHSTVDIGAELAKALELIHFNLRKRLIRVVRESANDTPTIYADRQRLRQVFLNLLTNASDSMPNGGILTLRTGPTALDNGKQAVLIELTDTGVGIPAENLERIMEPFFTTKEEGKGTGLGLAICRRVVQEHGGKIEIDSEVGIGTSVRMVLPTKHDHNVERLRGTGRANPKGN